MSGTILDIVELLLTAEIYNRYPELDVNDLPKKHPKKTTGVAQKKTVPKPITATFIRIEKLYGLKDIEKNRKERPLHKY
ncbi:hypothetical protein [Methanosarcina barkeri]|uniref:hypothetical protein n=1 Tax=Methanosarcina barkeri TaxID=2208 RepID=UPI000AFE50BA